MDLVYASSNPTCSKYTLNFLIPSWLIKKTVQKIKVFWRWQEKGILVQKIQNSYFLRFFFSRYRVFRFRLVSRIKTSGLKVYSTKYQIKP